MEPAQPQTLTLPAKWEQQLACVVVRNSLAIQADEIVLIRGPLIAQSFVLALAQELIDVGAHPLTAIEHPLLIYKLYAQGNEKQITWTSPLRTAEAAHIHAEITIYAPTLPQDMLMKLPPSRRVFMERKGLGEGAMRLRAERTQSLQYRTLYVLYPTPEFASMLQISLAELTLLIQQGALLAGNEDPLLLWERTRTEVESWQRWLQDRSELRIQARGTDVHCSLKNRSFFSQSGQHLLPGSQLLTMPHVDSWQGYITFNTVSKLNGSQISYPRICLDGGRVTGLEAEQGAEMLRAMLQVDAGAGSIGEFGIGLNPQLSRLIGATPFDELVRGTVHLAFGKSYPGAGAINRSRIHLDLVIDMREGGTVAVDGVPILQDGLLRAQAQMPPIP